MNKEEYIKQWSEKLSTPEDIIIGDYELILKQESQLHPDLTPADHESNALRRLGLSYKKQLRSPAVGFEGMVFAVSDCVDVLAKQHREAKQMFVDNPQDATAKGITNEDGVPLVTRKEWPDGRPNRDYGKPVPEHSYIRNVFGVAIKTGRDKSPRTFSMTMRGKRAQDVVIAMNTPIRFRAIDKSEQDSDHYTLNSSTFTTFEEDKKLQLPTPDVLISKNMAFSDISELSLYHEREKDNYNRLCVIKGDVSMLNLEPTSTGSRIMVIEDSSKMLEDIESPGVTCWVPEHVNIDFGEQSKVIVIGRTSQGKKRDDQGNFTDELGEVMINVMGVYALPDFKVNPEVVELSEENTRVSGEESPSEKSSTKEEEAWKMKI